MLRSVKKKSPELPVRGAGAYQAIYSHYGLVATPGFEPGFGSL